MFLLLTWWLAMGTPKAFLSVAYLVASSRALWARPVAPAATCHNQRKHMLVKYLLTAVLDLGYFEEGSWGWGGGVVGAQKDNLLPLSLHLLLLQLQFGLEVWFISWTNVALSIIVLTNTEGKTVCVLSNSKQLFTNHNF